ncbi:non-ribosomal peptide synthetase, partial [Virgisporangium aurantiacum]|uniref:non-ribosomal peptide synthetase n=1 Tax=Virgisporangium aurantiacum TaxID=175570 RepID=UPI00194F2C90
VMFTYGADPSGDDVAFPDVAVCELPAPVRTAKFDLTLSIGEAGPCLAGSIQYATDLYDHTTVERMATHFRGLLREFARNPEQRVWGAPMLTDDETRQMLEHWNATTTEVTPAPVHELIAAQAQRCGDAVAVVTDDSRMSYRELDDRADRLAWRLRDETVGPEPVVAVCMERGADLVVCLLAALKAGAVYLPLDPHDPPGRLEMLLRRARAGVVLTHRQWIPRLPDAGVRLLCVDDAAEATDLARRRCDAPPAVAVHPARAAYLFFTSGSTGTPKGVVGHHGGLTNRVAWARAGQRAGPRDVFLHKTATAFDVSLWEMLCPLMLGATLAVARPGGHRDPDYLAALIARERVTVVHFVPSMLRAFLADADLADCGSVRLVVCSGEALPPDLIADHRRSWGTELQNLYGPTEASIEATAARCEGGVPSIGVPIANVRVYVVDQHLQPVPIGVPGELLIGGIGIARGYLGRPDHTAHQFIANPFTSDGTRLYRTGDRARWHTNGTLEYLGRTDHQLKIRGHRIEPAEIEHALTTHPHITQAAVTTHPDPHGNPQLTAYITTTSPSPTDSPTDTPTDTPTTSPTITDIRHHLTTHLPHYLIPTHIITLPTLPTTNTGKTDKTQLPPPDHTRPLPTHTYQPPTTPTEHTLTTLWTNLLNTTPIGIHDNFFELGGDSITALQLIARAHTAGLHLTPHNIFTHQTIATLATTTTPTTPTTHHHPTTGPHPLTPI